MDKLIFDAGPLITTCKFVVNKRFVIDHILDASEIVIAESVHDEVVIAGAHYADAQAAKERVVVGKITVQSPPPNPDLTSLIAPYKLGQGEQDSIVLLSHVDLKNSVLVVDDHLAYLVSARLGQPRLFLLDAIVSLVLNGNLEKEIAIRIVENVRSRYPAAFIDHTLLLLRR